VIFQYSKISVTKSAIVILVILRHPRLKFTKMTSANPVTPFFGREAELGRLQDLTRKKVASIAVIKGRRRVGKSRLTDELAQRLPRYRRRRI